MNVKKRIARTLVAAGLVIAMTTGLAMASIGTGIVTGSSLRLRSEPGTNGRILATLSKNTAVDVLEELDNGWYKVSYKNTVGYMSGKWLDVTRTEGTSADTENSQGTVNAGPLNVRSGPGTSYSKVGSLGRGASVTVVDKVNGWYKITSGKLSGYVSADYVVILDGTAVTSKVGQSAAAMAASLVGCRYVYGAEGPNTFDCSGLFYYIFGKLGYKISRGSSAQYRNNGVFVSRENIQPGDLVFFFDPKFDGSGGTLPTTHVGMYMGNNQFIHASTVSYKVQYDTLFGSYYGNYIVGFKRIG